MTAKSSALVPSGSVSSTLAPASRRTRAASICPARAANRYAVNAPLLLRASRSAPASMSAFAEAAKALIDAGADLEARSRSGAFTAYLFAARAGHIDAARVLLEAGANVDETLPDGTSALLLAVMNAH